MATGTGLALPPSERFESDTSVERRQKADGPEEIAFRTKLELGTVQLRTAAEDRVPRGVVLAEDGYGNSTPVKDGVAARGLAYVVELLAAATVCPPGEGPAPAPACLERRRPPNLLARDETHQSLSVGALARRIGRARLRSVTWRYGTGAFVTSILHAVRVRPAHRDWWRAGACPLEWRLIEWPSLQKAPAKCFLSTLPADAPLATLLRKTRLWLRIERDDEESKDEIRLDHCEGRDWQGFRRHATPRMAADGFLAVERGSFPPRALRFADSRSRSLPYPQVPGRGELPMRPERHLTDSIETRRLRIALVLLATTSRCPWCQSTLTNHAPAHSGPPTFLKQ